MSSRSAYEVYLLRAVERLKGVTFGRSTKTGRFDQRRWEKVDAPKGTKWGHMLMLKKKHHDQPHDAIMSIFRHPGNWTLDCAEFVQVVHLYAVIHLIHETQFDHRFGKKEFRLSPHDSTGIVMEQGFSIDRRSGTVWRQGLRMYTSKEPKTMDQIAAEAPIGSRVAVSKVLQNPDDPYATENTVKVMDDPGGDITLVGLGFGKNTVFSLSTLKQLLGKDSYVSEVAIYQIPRTGG